MISVYDVWKQVICKEQELVLRGVEPRATTSLLRAFHLVEQVKWNHIRETL